MQHPCPSCSTPIPDGAQPCACGATSAPRPQRPIATNLAPVAARYLPNPKTARAAALDALAALGGQLGALTIVAGMVIALTSSSNTGPGQWFDVATWLTGMGLGGSLTASAGGTVVGISGAAQATLALHPLTLTATALTAVWLCTVRRERRTPTTTTADNLGASLTTGAVYAIALWILSATTQADDLAPDLHLALATGAATFGSFVLVTATAFTARAREHQLRTTGAGLAALAARRLGAWYAPLATGATLGGTAVALGWIAGVIGVLVQHGANLATKLGLSLLLAPNLGITAAGLGSGATVSTSTSAQFDASIASFIGDSLPSTDSSHGYGILSGSLPPAAYLTLLIPIVAAGLTAIRLAATTPAHDLAWNRLWRYAAATAALWLVLAYAAQVRLDVSLRIDGNQDFGFGDLGQNTGTLAAGVSVLGAALAAAVWAALAYAAAHKGRDRIAALPDGLTRFALRLPGTPVRTTPAAADTPDASAADAPASEPAR